LAGTLSDRDLRRQTLKLADPYKQPGLIRTIPKGVTLVDIINLYAFERWPAEKVFCVNCSGHRHMRGFTALLSDGKRILLGSQCGAELFGDSWFQAERRMQERSKRQWELDRLDRLEPIFRPLRTALRIWSSRIKEAMDRRRAFEDTLGELASRLNEALVSHGGWLTVTRSIETKSAQAAGLTSTMSEVVRVVQFHGCRAFIATDFGVVEKAIAALDSMQECSLRSETISTKELAMRRRRLEHAFENLASAAEMYRGAQALFTERGFKTVVGWTDRYDVTREKFRYADGCIRRDGAQGGVRLPCSRLPDLDDEVFELLAEYRRSD
jgi:hypothetical protein